MATAKSVLVVDDDQNLAHVLMLRLRSAGFNAECCYSGQQAIDMLKEKRYDMVLLDLLLPGKDGFGVLKELPDTKNGATPVTVLTCLGQEENMQRAKDLGAKECLVKSYVSIQEVVENLKKSLGI